MAARGAKTVLVSGGFTRFAEPVGKEIGFERVVANVLDVDAARLTGTVQLPIVDAMRKRAELEKAVETYGIASEQTMAVGASATDILMMQAAGLDVGEHANLNAPAAADGDIVHSHLCVVLYAQG